MLFLAYHAGLLFLKIYQKPGQLGLNLMGGGGMFAVSLMIPIMGRWFDEAKAKAVAAGVDATAADAAAGSNTFLKVAVMPCYTGSNIAALFM